MNMYYVLQNNIGGWLSKNLRKIYLSLHLTNYNLSISMLVYVFVLFKSPLAINYFVDALKGWLI